MNAPVTPSIDLAPLGTLTLAKKKSLRGPSLLTASLVTAGALAWRFAPMVIERRRTLARRKSQRAWWIAGGAGLAAAALATWQLQRLFSAEPEHEVEERRGPLEIRRYAPIRVARTTIQGGGADALDRGFRRLAGFIFGGNAEKLKIPMTSPVTSAEIGDDVEVAFVMPVGIVPPTPNDVRIDDVEIPARRVAVLRFNGRYDAESIEAKKRELLGTAHEAGLVTTGAPLFAGYDPPTTLPLLRRNEVWVEIEG